MEERTSDWDEEKIKERRKRRRGTLNASQSAFLSGPSGSLRSTRPAPSLNPRLARAPWLPRQFQFLSIHPWIILFLSASTTTAPCALQQLSMLTPNPSNNISNNPVPYYAPGPSNHSLSIHHNRPLPSTPTTTTALQAINISTPVAL